MAHYKLNEEDDAFLGQPQGAVLVASGTDGASTFIERDKDTTVRIVISSVAIATADAGALETVIEIDGGRAEGRSGPAQADTHLQAVQSVQIVVKPGQRLAFKAYPNPTSARVMKTVVYTADMT